ncbi:MAG TPA: cytochrome c3 family protein, partial [Candidatus Xenobia bacterium]
MRLLTVVGTVALVIGFWAVFEWEFRTEPQPIQFPHKVHAGERQIACTYCHTGAKKWDMAGVPSVQDCYQCHQVIT